MSHFHLYMCVMCYCVIIAPACTPEGPLRLKRTVFSRVSSHQVAPICTLHRVLSHFACTRAKMNNVTKIPRPIWAAHGLTRQRRYGYWESERRRSEPLDDRMSEGYTSFESVAQCAIMHTVLPLQAESTKLPLFGRVRAVNLCGQLKEKTGDTGDAALKFSATLETPP